MNICGRDATVHIRIPDRGWQLKLQSLAPYGLLARLVLGGLKAQPRHCAHSCHFDANTPYDIKGLPLRHRFCFTALTAFRASIGVPIHVVFPGKSHRFGLHISAPTAELEVMSLGVQHRPLEPSP
jgi:hypothetical protein